MTVHERVEATHHIDPGPTCSIIAAVPTHPLHQEHHEHDAHNASPPYAQYHAADPLPLANREPPYSGEKLAVYKDAHDRAMRREQKVIEPHRRLGSVRVSESILRLDRWREEERGRRNSIAGEAEDVERGEVDCETERRFAKVVFQRLWVERGAPVCGRVRK